MKYVITFFFSVIFISPAIAQITFSRTYSPDAEQVGREVFQTSDGGYLIQATIIDNWNKCYLMKMDAFGDTLWTKTYGTDSIQYLVYDAIETNDGGYILAGDYQRVDTWPNMDAYIQKIDSLGNEVWFNKYGQNVGKDHATLIKKLSNGEVLIEGFARYLYNDTAILNSISFNGYIAKFNPVNGVFIKAYSIKTLLFTNLGSGNEWHSKDIEVVGNTIFVLGEIIPSIGPKIKKLLAFDLNLDTLYTVSSNLNNHLGLSSTIDEHLLLFGDNTLTKMDTLGNVVWNSSYYTSSIPYEFIETSTGEFISIGGISNIRIFDHPTLIGSATSFLNKFNNQGQLMWSKTFTSSANINLGYGLIECADNGYAFVGRQEDDIWFVKTDSLGNVVTSVTYPLGNTNKISVYPNPANNFVIVESDAEISQLEILNTQGQVLIKEKYNSRNERLDVSKLTPGIYFYKVYSDNEFSAGKLIKK